MKAVAVYQSLPIDDPRSLVDIDLPEPEIGPLDLLVQVEAISVNPADCRVRLRKADDGNPAVLGWDVAGRVVRVGANASSHFSPGDMVYYAGDLSRAGANSEFHAIDHRIVAIRPRSISAQSAAAVPLTALTAWEALFDRMDFSPFGENKRRSLLIVGAAGGVGSMAIQLAALMRDVTIIATASRHESQAWCRKLGAHIVVNHCNDLRSELENAGYKTVDAVLLLNNPDHHFAAVADMLAPQGCICSVVPFDHPPDMNAIMRKSATFSWEFMFTRSMFQTNDIAEQGVILRRIASLIDEGSIASPMTMVLTPINAENLRNAHRRLESKRTIGKITLFGF